MQSIITVQDYRLILPYPSQHEVEKNTEYTEASDEITILDDDLSDIKPGYTVVSDDFPENTVVVSVGETSVIVSEDASANGTGIIEFSGINIEEDARIQMHIDVAQEELLSLCSNDQYFIDNGYPSVFKFIMVKAVNRLMTQLTKDYNIQSEKIARYSVSYKDSLSNMLFDESDLNTLRKYSRSGIITFKNAYRGQ